MNTINKEITRRVHEEVGKIEDNNHNEPCMNDPISVFVSMETEVGYNNLAAIPEILLGNTKSKTREAPEPTNIIWENYDMSKAKRAVRIMFLVIIMLSLFTLIFMINFWAISYKRSLLMKYDTTIPCVDLTKIYSNDELS